MLLNRVFFLVLVGTLGVFEPVFSTPTPYIQSLPTGSMSPQLFQGLSSEDAALLALDEISVGPLRHSVLRTQANALTKTTLPQFSPISQHPNWIQSSDVLSFQQQVDGIPVYGGMVKVHVGKDHVPTKIIGRVISSPIDMSESISLSTAQHHVDALFQVPFSRPSSPKKMIFQPDYSPGVLTWFFETLTQTPVGRWHTFVSVQSGKIVAHFNTIDTVKSWDTYSTNTSNNLSLNSMVFVSTLELSDDQSGAEALFSDVHGYVSDTYDYFLNTFGIHGYDNNDATMVSFVQRTSASTPVANAYWASDYMYFGAGGDSFGPLGVKDVVAHEYGHAVTEYLGGNLKYFGEPGAINESMSDVWGAMVDRDNWMIGEAAYVPGDLSIALRYMDHPSLDGSSPDSMSDYQWSFRDSANVHTNSGIPNRAYYLLATAQSKSIAEQVYFYAMRHYFTQSMLFTDLYDSIKSAAIDLYGEDSSVAASVDSAFDAVGLVPVSLTGDFVTASYTSPRLANETDATLTFSYSGATQLALRFTAFSTEAVYDRIAVRDSANRIKAVYSGNLGAFDSAAVEGDTLYLDILTDSSVLSDGFTVSGLIIPSGSDVVPTDNSVPTSNEIIPNPSDPDESPPPQTPLTVTGLINGPNPFSSLSQTTTFEYTLSTDADVRLTLYSISGRTVYSQSISAGSPGGTAGLNTALHWDGRQDGPVGNGVYIAYFVFTNSVSRVVKQLKVAVLN